MGFFEKFGFGNKEVATAEEREPEMGVPGTGLETPDMQVPNKAPEIDTVKGALDRINKEGWAGEEKQYDENDEEINPTEKPTIH